jgi:hypothetical protein
MGCNGGWYTNAWDYLKNAGGSARRGLYPYTGTVIDNKTIDVSPFCNQQYFHVIIYFLTSIDEFRKILASSPLPWSESRLHHTVSF